MHSKSEEEEVVWLVFLVDGSCAGPGFATIICEGVVQCLGARSPTLDLAAHMPSHADPALVRRPPTYQQCRQRDGGGLPSHDRLHAHSGENMESMHRLCLSSGLFRMPSYSAPGCCLACPSRPCLRMHPHTHMHAHLCVPRYQSTAACAKLLLWVRCPTWLHAGARRGGRRRARQGGGGAVFE